MTDAVANLHSTSKAARGASVASTSKRAWSMSKTSDASIMDAVADLYLTSKAARGASVASTSMRTW